MDPSWLRSRRGGVELSLRIVPRGRPEGPAGTYGDRLRFKLSAEPFGGEANRRLERLLARAARVAPSKVRVVLGQRSRSKTVLVESEDPESTRRALLSALRIDNRPDGS